MGRGIAFFTRLLVLIASLAMSATGFAHRFSDAQSSPELLSYLSIGGSLSDICGDIDHSHHLASTCDACLIASNALMPVASVALPQLLSCKDPAQLSGNTHQWTVAVATQTYRPRAPPTAVTA